MNILLLNWQDIRNPLAGGAEVHLFEIFSRIANRGHNVTLFCSSFQGAPKTETIDGIHVIRYGHRNFFNYIVPWYYKKHFQHQPFDVVVDDVNKIPFYTPLYVRKPLTAIFLHLFGKSIFHEVGFLSASYVALAEKLIPHVYKKTHLMVLSESTATELEHNGFARSMFTFVYGCVNHNIFRKTGIQKSDKPRIGVLGRLKKYKSVEHAILAFAEVKKEIPSAELIVIGDGDYKNELEKIVNGLHLQDAVHFTGFVSEEEKVHLLQTMHVVVQPSSKEGWGLTVIEANACGVCCIASNVQGLREAVVDGETGFLFEYGNVEQLAEKILLVLKNESLRTQLETNALTWAKKFDWEKSADAALEAMGKVCYTK